MTMGIREELRTYSKGDLTRIAVAATRKQAAAEQRWRRLVGLFWVLMTCAFGAGVVVGVGLLWMAGR